ncbi:MAG: hypothetical protein R3321_13545 [Nitrososphaeraceae archaeon]|nr:hypothetical protein [Nitrososphaeraceae archaeon]
MTTLHNKIYKHTMDINIECITTLQAAENIVKTINEDIDSLMIDKYKEFDIRILFELKKKWGLI